MRTYREQTQVILSKIEQKNKMQKRKRSILCSSLAAAACMAVIVMAFMYPKLMNHSSIFLDKGNGADKDTGGLNYSSNHDGNLSTDSETDIIFNQIKSVAMDSARLYFDPEKTYEEKLNDSDVSEYFGKEVRPDILPESVKYWGDENPEFLHTLIYNNDGTICFDRFVFSYAQDFNDYDPLAKRIDISVSKVSSAQSNCIYVWSEEMKSSKINGIEVMIGEQKMPYGPYTVVDSGPNIPAGYYNLFVADYSYDGINYQVVCDNFTKEEFVEAIDSMIK